jgi:hypothetical protein
MTNPINSNQDSANSFGAQTDFAATHSDENSVKPPQPLVESVKPPQESGEPQQNQ